MLWHTCFGLGFTLIVLWMATSPMQGQTMSFLRQFTVPGMDRATAVAADASGIYVIGNRPGRAFEGRAGVRKYDSRGNELWTREFSVSEPGRAAADATGVYVVGYVRSESGEIAAQSVRKYSADGTELWTRQLECRPLAARG